MRSVVVISGEEIVTEEPRTRDSEITRRKLELMLHRTRAKRVFEIGFGEGSLARILLDMKKDDPDFRVHSIDKCEYAYVEKVAIALNNKDERFTFQKYDSNEYDARILKDYDLLIIDGAKDEETLRNDLLLGIESKIDYMLVMEYDFQYNDVGARVGACINSFVGDVDHKVAFFGQPLHIERNKGTSACRLILNYNARKKHSPREQDLMKKQ